MSLKLRFEIRKKNKIDKNGEWLID